LDGEIGAVLKTNGTLFLMFLLFDGEAGAGLGTGLEIGFRIKGIFFAPFVGDGGGGTWVIVVRSSADLEKLRVRLRLRPRWFILMTPKLFEAFAAASAKILKLLKMNSHKSKLETVLAFTKEREINNRN